MYTQETQKKQILAIYTFKTGAKLIDKPKQNLVGNCDTIIVQNT